MSIFSDAANGKITFSTAVAEIGQWVSKWVSSDPTALAVAGQVESDLKQAASNAVAIADTALGTLIATAGISVETAANTLITKSIGPGAVLLTPAVDAAITTATNALKSEIDGVAAQIRASLQPASASAS